MFLRLLPHSGLLLERLGSRAIARPSNKLPAPAKLDSDTQVSKVKRFRGKKLPLSSAGVQGLREEYNRSVEPARTRPVRWRRASCLPVSRGFQPGGDAWGNGQGFGIIPRRPTGREGWSGRLEAGLTVRQDA